MATFIGGPHDPPPDSGKGVPVRSGPALMGGMLPPQAGSLQPPNPRPMSGDWQMPGWSHRPDKYPVRPWTEDEQALPNLGQAIGGIPGIQNPQHGAPPPSLMERMGGPNYDAAPKYPVPGIQSPQHKLPGGPTSPPPDPFLEKFRTPRTDAFDAGITGLAANAMPRGPGRPAAQNLFGMHKKGPRPE